ncbi:Tiny macrocysts protein C [Tetrabaena socialis]|uniref:Tiny macrocysts protein C n=1 Tax=Tetrabaena socialis TaxID=47790 RepID=A0A2J8AI24_9CHLO|nr:Tiny macrocysts protein C [Tetrabaena socialis]|eukprot:PNH12169.1 Tiny macrocysts protein C [Tetrabaena socialis]
MRAGFKARVWAVVSVLSFRWLKDVGYGAYLALLYSMVALLAINIGLCVWVAWCFKEQKFPAVWPIKMLRVFSSVFFQAFDVTSLTLLQLGINCRYAGNLPHMRFDLFPEHTLSLVLFVTIALFLNMAEVEVNPLGQRPLALGHSGAEVMAFAIKLRCAQVLLTLVDVFLPWPRVSACAYLALSLALAWQYLRWAPHLVPWANYLKSGVSVAIFWCSAVLMLLVFRPGVSSDGRQSWEHSLTLAMLAGLAPAFAVGALMSWGLVWRLTSRALKALDRSSTSTDAQLKEIAKHLDDPRDVEIVARICRKTDKEGHPEPEAVGRAHQIVQAGLATFPTSPFVALYHANFMIDVFGVAQGGARRIEDARKLKPELMCRFIIFVRHQVATQKAAGNSANDGTTMDLLGYVEYQRKQRNVVRLHREALQASCTFWRTIDATSVPFTRMSKALNRIESSVSQTAYRAILEQYSNNPKLVRLYGKFLERIKNDPWGAQEYFAEADRLEDMKSSDAHGPFLPDGTPLSRMDEMAIGVLVVNSTGEVQIANTRAHVIFGYKRGMLDTKPLSLLLAPHDMRRVSDLFAGLVSIMGDGATPAIGSGSEPEPDILVVGMHCDRVAFPLQLSIRKALGVGEDSTFMVLVDPMPLVPGVATLWVVPNGTVTACDPHFVAITGWKAAEVHGTSVAALLSLSSSSAAGQAGGHDDVEAGAAAQGQIGTRANDVMTRLLGVGDGGAMQGSMSCFLAHKYDETPMECDASIKYTTNADAPGATICEIRVRLVASEPAQLLVVNRKGAIKFASTELVMTLRDKGKAAPGVAQHSCEVGDTNAPHMGGTSADNGAGLEAYNLSEFLPPFWKETHMKLMKETTTMTRTTAAARGMWSCRGGAAQGPTLELWAMSGKAVYMHVRVATVESQGEMTHVVRLTRSSLDIALGERRLRLSIAPDGRVADVSKETPKSLFGVDPSQVHVVEPTDEDPDDTPPAVFVDLWPAAAVTGVVQLDGSGRITAVLEEATRPAGLLFGLPGQSLIGQVLLGGSLLMLPPGRSGHTDLLTLHGAKKSSMKTARDNGDIKVGPVHVLQGKHSDGARPLLVEVQVVGKPGRKQPATVLLRLHAAPMMSPAVAPLALVSSLATPPASFAANVMAEHAELPVPQQLATAQGFAGPLAEFEQEIGHLVSSSRPLLSRPGTAVALAAESLRVASSVTGPDSPSGTPRPNMSSPPAAVLLVTPSDVGLIDTAIVTAAAATAAVEEAGRSTLASLVRSMAHEKGFSPTVSRRDQVGLIKNISGADGTIPGDPKWKDGDDANMDKPDNGSIASGSDRSTRKDMGGAAERVSTWVVSKGAFYQNALEKGENEAARLSDDDAPHAAGADPGKGAMKAAVETGVGLISPNLQKGSVAGSEDDDDASEGGLSGISAQTGKSGAEYKRGKRFRKLAKLMDSSIAQQVQQRLQTHALLTVALLVVVHVICFALTVVALVQQVLTDVRSLDVLSRNVSAVPLYTAADAPMFVERIARASDEFKVWDGVNEDGSDSYVNLTVKAFSTRFYAMAKVLEQKALSWLHDGVHVAGTYPGQLMLKSGPDLFGSSEEVIDELLYEASDDSAHVKLLQLVFLAVEGFVITCAAALYVAYLLHAVAAQRHKLYGSFLLIPVGDEEDDDEDEEDTKETAAAEEAVEDDPKLKRRARLMPGGGGSDPAVNTSQRPSRTANATEIGRSTSLRIVGDGQLDQAKRTLRTDSRGTMVMLVPFVIWSILVIAIYTAAVSKMQGVVEAVAVQSVVNFMGARVQRAVFFSQELAVAETPQEFQSRRTALEHCNKLVVDAWFTLQLGADAYKAAGNDCELFPLVKTGLSYASPELQNIFYSTSSVCHRVGENLPCPGWENRFFKISRTGLDAIMQEFFIKLRRMTSRVLPPLGLESDAVDFIYTVGGKDLLDGVQTVATAHDELILLLFRHILVYHVVLFVGCIVIFIGFILLLLNPLLKRVTKERRRIAELMSQLPMECDVEKLVSRALNPATKTTDGSGGGTKRPIVPNNTTVDGGEDATSASQWKAIIRMGSGTAGPPSRQLSISSRQEGR